MFLIWECVRYFATSDAFPPLPPLPQEYADALNELTPEQAEEHRRSVEKALAAARELEVVKQKLDEQRIENEQKLQQENEGWLALFIVSLLLKGHCHGDFALFCAQIIA